MNKMLQKIKQASSTERILCRTFASWFCFIAYQLIKDGNFANLEYAQATPLWYMLFYAGAIFACFSCVSILLPKLETDTWSLMGSLLICVARWLLSYQNHFFTIVIIIILSLFAVYFIKKNKSLLINWQPGSQTIWGVALLLGIFSAFMIGTITCLRYLIFSAPNYDFGIFVNMFHNMRETGLPLCTCERDVLLSHFVIHVSPIYYLLLPFYALFPSPLTLQIAQGVILASGVIPVVLLCKRFRLSGKITILIAAIYCLFPALTTGCYFDIHENCFLAPLLLWMFYSYERKNWWCVYLFAVLTLLVKEDAAIYVLLFAVYLLFSRKTVGHSLVLFFGALVYFIVMLIVLRDSGAYYADLYANSTPNPDISGPMVGRYNSIIYNPSDGLFGAIKTLLVNPGYLLTQLLNTADNSWNKVLYFLQIFAPLGFIPFLTNKPSRWLLVTPVLLNLITGYAHQYNIGFQYNFGIIAFLTYATILNSQDLKAPVRKNILCFAVVACCCLYFVSVIPVFRNSHTEWKNNREKYVQTQAVLDTIPKDASVCCSTFLLPHLADRNEIYEVYYHENVGDVDYVIFDARYAIDAEQLNAYISQGYVVTEEWDGRLLILQKI